MANWFVMVPDTQNSAASCPHMVASFDSSAWMVGSSCDRF